MDKEGLKTLVLIGAGTMIGSFLRGLMQSGQKPSPQLIARAILCILVIVAIAFFAFKRIK